MVAPQQCAHYDIEAWAAWLPFSRQNFQTDFIQWLKIQIIKQHVSIRLIADISA